MTMLPNLPAPMTAKFVYPDMIELKLWRRVFEFWVHLCSTPPPIYSLSGPSISNITFLYRPSHGYYPPLSEPSALSISAMVTLTKSLA